MWCSKACFSLQFLQQKAQSLSRRCWIWLFIFLIKIIDFNSIERKNMDHENQASICHSCYEGPLLASQDVLLWRSCVHASHQLCWGPIVRLSWLISTFPKEAITIPTTKDTDILPLNSKKTIPKMSIFQAGYIQKFIVDHYAKCPDCTHHCDDVSHIIVNRSQKLVKAGEIASQMAPKTNAIDIPSLKLTFLPLKIDVWRMMFAFWKGVCSGAILIFRKISICVTLLLFHQPGFPWRGNCPARKKTTYRWRHATSLQFQSNMYTYINMYILVYTYIHTIIYLTIYTHKYINM